MAHIKLIYGGPGTGKTHALLDELEKTLASGVKANEIAYVSFTRQGTYQGVDLAKDKFDLTEADCVYFKTLHSLAYHCLECSPDQIIGYRDLQPMISKLNLHHNQFNTIDSKLNIAKNKQDLDSLNKEAYKGVSLGQAHLTAEVYEEYKKLLKKLDFADLLLLVKEQRTTIPVKVVFIDEAQDLTRLQWQVVLQFFKDTPNWIIAGDPNQSIFEWAGADVPYFLNMRTDEQVVLEKSYRCSRAVWSMAKSFYACITEKAPIPDKGTDEEGFAIVNPTEQLPQDALFTMAKQGSLMCLAIQNTYLDRYIDCCVAYGIPYALKAKGNYQYCLKLPTLRFMRKLYKALFTIEGYKQYITDNATCSRHQSRADRNFKEKLRAEKVLEWATLPPEQRIQPLIEYIKTKTHKPDEQAFLIRAMLSGNIDIADDYVLITNIHQVKGAESDYVLLCDNVASVYRNQADNDVAYRDYLLRVFYVGVTRAKKGVCIWHRDNYSTVAPTAVFNNIGILQTQPLEKSAYAEQYINEHYTKEQPNENN